MAIEQRYTAFETAKNYTKHYELDGIDSILTRQEDGMMGYVSAGQFATTGSNIFEGGQIIDGNLTIVGDIYANEFLVTTSSTEHFTASTSFGLDSGDTHTFTGSVKITGSLDVIGATTTLGNMIMTGSLLVSGSTTQIGNNTLTGNTQLTGSVNISGSLNVNTHPVVLGQLSWARYDDTQYTTSSFRSVTVAGGEVTLPNNGGYSVTTHLHSDIQFYNTGSQRVYAEKEGDVYLMTISFRAKTANANVAYARIQMDSTGLTPYRRVGKDLFFGKGNDEWHDYHEVFQFYADTDFVANGNQWKIRAYGATVDISNVIYFIQRTQNHLI
jgi:hypothetical protein